MPEKGADAVVAMKDPQRGQTALPTLLRLFARAQAGEHIEARYAAALAWLAGLEQDLKKRNIAWAEYWRRRNDAQKGGVKAFTAFLTAIARDGEQVSTLRLTNSSPDPLYLTLQPFGDRAAIPPNTNYVIVALTGPASLQIESDESHFTVWLGKGGEIVHGVVFCRGQALFPTDYGL